MSKRLVSGIQPSGDLHIGNYLGAVKQWVALQHDYDCFFFVADYHALTQLPEAKTLRQQTLQTAAMLIALGIDPKSSPLFAQSQVPEHAELMWLLSSQARVGQLTRMTQYKEKSDRHGENVGLFTYPILMAADILLYQPEVVPVGHDQVQHLELTRDIAESFNNRYGQTFTVPRALLDERAARIMSLQDPSRKMSKSVAGSAIGLLDDEASITQAIKRAVTDSDPNAEQASPAVANLLTILEGISGSTVADEFEAKRRDGALRYSELKEQLIEDVVAFLGPIQKTYESLIKEEGHLVEVLEHGAAKARPVAQATLKKAKRALGLIG
jgi:tryptophanyl-tRNA synthetase